MSKEQTQAVWGANPAGNIHAKGLQPGTREYFETTARVRNEEESPWLFEVIPFASFRDKKVLELGCGAGYDALEFHLHGADYTGVDLTPQNIERTKTHLGFYGYTPNVQQGDAEHLPFADNTFEIVYSNGVLHHTPDMPQSFREAFRVLKPGGEFWVILYHKHSIFYWITLGLVDHLLMGGFRKRTFRERLGMIEYTTSDELPLVNVYSRGELHKILTEAGFQVQKMWVRQLRKEDMPGFPVICRLWKHIPRRWLECVGRWFGWYVIACARKV